MRTRSFQLNLVLAVILVGNSLSGKFSFGLFILPPEQSNNKADFNQIRTFTSKYIESGVDELDVDKLPNLMTIKYQAQDDAMKIFGSVKNARETFIGFQKHLYKVPAK
jgi:hypothetical protein